MAFTTPRSGYRLTDRYTEADGTVFMTGIQALARIPIEQLQADRRSGLNTAAFVSGYPGSPLGGYDKAIAEASKIATELPIVHRPALNEEYAASAVMGSQLAGGRADARYDGVVGLWYGKAPGVDRASDALRHAGYAGSWWRGGAVALAGDDPMAKSSSLPSSSAAAFADMHFPLLYPADPAEALDLGRHAVALSRATGLWSALKIVADVADGTATVVLDSDRIQPIMPLHDGERYRRVPEGELLPPHNLDLERQIYEVRYPLAVEYVVANRLNHAVINPSDAWIGLIASGITYRELRGALTRLGLEHDDDIAGAGIRILRMQVPMPFDPNTIRRFATGLDEVFVVEEKQPNIESLVKDALYGVADRPRVVGKTDEHHRELLPGYGGLVADKIAPALRTRLAPRLADRLAPERVERQRTLIPLAVERTPFFCSGCPHNRSTKVPEGSLVGAGIGCHTMTLLMGEERVGDIVGLTAMGNEGTQWLGMEDFLETDHLFQNLGDGTFHHSGQLAVQAAVAAGATMTYKLLYNGTVAMTGGQDAPGQLTVPAIALILDTIGVARVLITTEDRDRYRGVALPDGVEVWDRSRLMEAQEVLAATSGVTVLIHDQYCAAEARRDRKRGLIPTPNERVVINERICEGCGDCGQVSNCLSVQPIETDFGRKTTIDQTTCNLDYSCLEGDCPSFMTVTTEPRNPRVDAAFDKASGLLDRIRPDRIRRGRPTETHEASAAGHAAVVVPDPPTDLPAPTLAVPDDEYDVRITGIGGTGVVTVAQILGTAAMFGGYEVRGLDQIGLSQKAGPVVSDLRFDRTAAAGGSRLGAQQADLLLALDQLVGASENGLMTCSPERTTVVGSTARTPTGAMITNPEMAMASADELGHRIASETRPDVQHWADAAHITSTLFGTSVTANMFVVGMAVQAGALPLDPDDVEAAIELNGVGVAANTAAFRWGRWQVADRTHVDAALDLVADDSDGRSDRVRSDGPGDAGDTASRSLPVLLAGRVAGLAAGDADLDTELTRWTAELIEFQDERLATRFLEDVEVIGVDESRAVPGSTALTRTFAAMLFKLLAYKDEYEVARLMVDEASTRSAHELAGPDGEVVWRLHPPMLKALGLDDKISIGPWAEPAIRALARGKRLRGTPLDPFGRAEVRRLERQLPDEYRSAIGEVARSVTAANLDHAVRIAALPDQVRGYEDLKVRRVAEYRTELTRELAAFGQTTADVPQT